VKPGRWRNTPPWQARTRAVLGSLWWRRFAGEPAKSEILATKMVIEPTKIIQHVDLILA